MDIYSLLHQDHDTLRALLSRLESAGVADFQKKKIQLSELYEQWLVHCRSKEHTFYAALFLSPLGPNRVSTALNEHDEITTVFSNLNDTHSAPLWQEQFEILSHELRAHFTQEEKEIFPLAMGVLSTEDAVALALSMNEQKKREQERLAHAQAC